MADPTPTTTQTDPGAAPAATPAPAAAVPNSLLGADDAAGAAPAPTTEQQAAAVASKARVDAWSAAATPDGRKAAYAALNDQEKAQAYGALSEADRKALGIEDPTLPVYDIAKFTLPEGVQRDEAALGQAAELLRGMKLSQDQAQKIIDFGSAREQAAAKANLQAFVDLQTKWVSEIKGDPEVGGAKLNASLASAAQAIDRLAIPGLKEALNLTGAGNNPAVVKAFVRLGQMMQEDRFVPGTPPPSAPVSPAERLYGPAGPKQSADA